MRFCFSMASCHFNFHARSLSIRKSILYFELTRRAESNGKLLLFMVHLNNYYYMWRSLANVQTFKTYARRCMIRWTLELKCWSTRDDSNYLQFRRNCSMLWLFSGNYSIYCFGVNGGTLSLRRFIFLQIQIPRARRSCFLRFSSSGIHSIQRCSLLTSAMNRFHRSFFFESL